MIDQKNLLKNYYSQIFPVNQLFKILQINENRELTFQNDSKTYIRYESFNSPSEFLDKISKINPVRIDVGAIYDSRPSKLNGAQIIGKELVFDIDLTDYDRECCSGKNMCEKCFSYIKCSMELLDYILKEEFGFDEIGFVFSGRRGLHCWVFGQNDLDSKTRADIYKYFQNVIDKNISNEKYLSIIKNTFSASDLIQKYFLRLDKEVTVKMSHLIKMPFSVHPETMKVSIPLDPQNLIRFEDLPDVEDLTSENILEYVSIMEKWRLK